MDGLNTGAIRNPSHETLAGDSNATVESEKHSVKHMSPRSSTAEGCKLRKVIHNTRMQTCQEAQGEIQIQMQPLKDDGIRRNTNRKALSQRQECRLTKATDTRKRHEAEWTKSENWIQRRPSKDADSLQTSCRTFLEPKTGCRCVRGPGHTHVAVLEHAQQPQIGRRNPAQISVDGWPTGYRKTQSGRPCACNRDSRV
jgi:hypothetical protein